MLLPLPLAQPHALPRPPWPYPCHSPRCCVPRSPGCCQPHGPCVAQLPDAPRKAESPAPTAGCPLVPSPHWGHAGPTARHCSAGHGRPPALATRPACHALGLPVWGRAPGPHCSLLPRGVAASPAPRLIWGQGPWGRTELCSAVARGRDESRTSSQGKPWNQGGTEWLPLPRGSCLLQCQPVHGTATGLVLPAELPHLAQSTALAQQPWHSQEPNWLLGAPGRSSVTPSKAMQETPSLCNPMCPIFPAWMATWGSHALSSPPQVLPSTAVTSTHQAVSALPLSWHRAGGVHGGQSSQPGFLHCLLHLQLVPGLGCGSRGWSEPRGTAEPPAGPRRTSHSQVVPPEAERLELERERRVRLLQVHVHPARLDRLPLQDRQQHLPAGTGAPCPSIPAPAPAPPSPARSPQGFLPCGRHNLCLDVDAEVKFEGEALLAGVLGEAASLTHAASLPVEHPKERGRCLTSVCRRRAFFLGSFSAELLRSLWAQSRQGDRDSMGWGHGEDTQDRGLTLCYRPVPPPPPPHQRQGWCVVGTSALTCCGPGWSLQMGVWMGCASIPALCWPRLLPTRIPAPRRLQAHPAGMWSRCPAHLAGAGQSGCVHRSAWRHAGGCHRAHTG